MLQALLLVEVTGIVSKKRSASKEKTESDDESKEIVSFEALANESLGSFGGQFTGMVYQVHLCIAFVQHALSQRRHAIHSLK